MSLQIEGEPENHTSSVKFPGERSRGRLRPCDGTYVPAAFPAGLLRADPARTWNVSPGCWETEGTASAMPNRGAVVGLHSSLLCTWFDLQEAASSPNCRQKAI